MTTTISSSADRFKGDDRATWTYSPYSTHSTHSTYSDDDATVVGDLENRVTQVEHQLGPTDPTQPQILPLRTEMRAEFSAVRSEMAEQGKALRAEMAEQTKVLRGDLTEQGDKLTKQGDKLSGKIEELQAKVDGQGTQMRVLHEDVISRIALLQEGISARPRRSRKE